MGLLASSIPTYGPLYDKFIRKSAVPSGKGSSATNESNTIGNSYNYTKGSQYSGQISAGQSTIGPNAGIRVTDQFELVRHVNRNGDWIRVEDEDEELQLFTPGTGSIP